MKKKYLFTLMLGTLLLPLCSCSSEQKVTIKNESGEESVVTIKKSSDEEDIANVLMFASQASFCPPDNFVGSLSI